MQHRLYRETNLDPRKAFFLNWGSTAIDRQAISRLVNGRVEIVEMKENLVPLFDCIDLCSLYRGCFRSLDVEMKFHFSVVWRMVFGSDLDAEVGKSHTARYNPTAAVRLAHHLADNVPAQQKKRV